MYKFAIRNKRCGEKNVAFLYYDEEKKEYEIEVPETVESKEAPLIIADFIKKNQRKIDKDWSLRWVKQRVTPPERQNLGQILKANHMKEYDEFPLLVKNEGRCCQDECYIVRMDIDR